MSADAVIRTEHLAKSYGRFVAVQDLNIEVRRGVLFGFIGPNGAGKTTTIRMLCGLLKPTGGRAFVAGTDVARHPRHVKGLVGYMPDLFGVYDRMRVWEYLDFFGAAYRIPRARRRDRIDNVLDLTGTAYMRDYFMGTLSKGMRQRVGIARTLVHDPTVLFLDEPTSGLDVVAQYNVQTFLRHYQETRGISILLTSHYMKDVAALCRRVVVISLGRIIYDGSLSGIIDRFGGHKVISLQMIDGQMPGDMARYGEVLSAEPPRMKLRVERSVVPQVLGEILASYAVADVSVEDPPLEQVIAEMFTANRNEE